MWCSWERHALRIKQAWLQGEDISGELCPECCVRWDLA